MWKCMSGIQSARRTSGVDCVRANFSPRQTAEPVREAGHRRYSVHNIRAYIPSHLSGDPSRDYLRPTNVDRGAPSWKPAFSCTAEKLCLRVICPFPLASYSGFTFRFLLREDTEERNAQCGRCCRERKRERSRKPALSGNFHSITGEHIEK